MNASTSFIRSIAAIIFRVTFPRWGNTTAVIAGELSGVAGDVDTSHFVGGITAIVVGIAAERIGNAATGCALIFVGRAGGSGAVLILIGVIEAVVIAVADPSLWDASLIVAREIPDVWTRLNGWFGSRVENTSFAVR